MKRAIACVVAGVVALQLGGCAAWKAMNFQADSSSFQGVGTAKVALVPLYETTSDPKTTGDPKAFADLVPGPADPEVEMFGSLVCGGPRTEKPPRGPGLMALDGVTLTIVGALVEFVFNQAIDWQQRQLDKLKSEANPDPITMRAAMPASAFLDASCLALVRYTDGEGGKAMTTGKRDVGLLALWKIDRPWSGSHKDDAFVLTPLYFRAKSSIAKAATPKDGGFPRMNLALAMSLRMVGRPPALPLPVLHTLGAAETAFQDVAFGCRKTDDCAPATTTCGGSKDTCKVSDLVPLPPRGGVVWVTVSVVEQGDVGLDFELAKAQLAALREVLGPTARSALETRFGE